MNDPGVRIGGSTIAAAAGIDPFCSRVELYYRLRGELPEPDSEPLMWGTLMQPLILAQVGATAWTDTPVHDPALPWLVGHPDGRLPDGRVVETKLTAGHYYRPDGPLPLGWQAQAQTYMRLTGTDSALVAVLVAGTQLDVRELRYDAGATDRLVALAARFVERFERGEPPEPDGSESAREALAAVYAEPEPGAACTLSAAGWKAMKRVRLLREQRDEVERQLREAENAVKAEAGEAETILSPYGTAVAHWKAVTSRRLDTAALKAARPEIYSEYLTESTSRRFTLA